MIESEIFGGTLNLQEARLCLDFANTADWHASDQPQEQLNSYTDLALWAQQIGILPKNDVQEIFLEAAHRPEDAAKILERAIDLRETIYRTFSAVAAGRPVAATDLNALNDWLRQASSRVQIMHTTAGFRWRWDSGREPLDRILWPVAQSAAELLISEELDRVKTCADDRGCGWLFLDTSRNRSRRWCSMQGCGNRAKVQRHRARHS